MCMAEAMDERHDATRNSIRIDMVYADAVLELL